MQTARLKTRIAMVRRGRLFRGKNRFLADQKKGCRRFIRFVERLFCIFINNNLRDGNLFSVGSQGRNYLLQFVGAGEFEENLFKVRMIHFGLNLQIIQVADCP